MILQYGNQYIRRDKAITKPLKDSRDVSKPNPVVNPEKYPFYDPFSGISWTASGDFRTDREHAYDLILEYSPDDGEDYDLL